MEEKRDVHSKSNYTDKVLQRHHHHHHHHHWEEKTQNEIIIKFSASQIYFPTDLEPNPPKNDKNATDTHDYIILSPWHNKSLTIILMIIISMITDHLHHNHHLYLLSLSQTLSSIGSTWEPFLPTGNAFPPSANRFTLTCIQFFSTFHVLLSPLRYKLLHFLQILELIYFVVIPLFHQHQSHWICF